MLRKFTFYWDVTPYRQGELCRTCCVQNQVRDVTKFIERLQYSMKTCLRFVRVCRIRLCICGLSYGALHLSDSVARSVRAIGE